MQGDCKSDEFRVGRRGIVADDVAVDLIELPEPAFLRFFKSEKGRNAEPFDWLAIIACARSNQASESWRHFRPHTDISTALVNEPGQLCFQFVAAFFLIEFGRLERWAVVFLKSK